MPDQRTSPGPSSPRQRWLYYAGSVIVLGLAFHPLIRPGRFLAAGDFVFFHLPLRTLFRSAVEAGFPWWNPALNGGQPILSNPNYAAFYPPSWLALILPVATALHFVLLLHVLWAFSGAWRLARHLGCRRSTAMLAATGFALAGSMVTTTVIMTLFCGLSWLPWILLWGHRALSEKRWHRPTTLLALGLAAQLLAGEPVACIVSGVALFAVAIDALASGSRTGLRLLAAVAVAVALAGIQLLPTAARLAESPRGAGEIESTAGLRSMHPVRFLEWAVPHPLGDPLRTDEGLYFGQSLNDKGFPYVASIYPGILIAVLALAGLARQGIPLRWAWLMMLLVGSALAIGRHNPLYLGGIANLPVLDQIRYPEKYILIATAALPFAAALKWDRLLDRPEQEDDGERSLAVVLAATITVVLAGLLVLVIAVPEAPSWMASSMQDAPVLPERADRLATWARAELSVAFLVAGLAWALLTIGRRIPRQWLAVSAVALLATDLAWQSRHSLPTVPLTAIREPTEVLREVDRGGRVFTDMALNGEALIPLRYDEPGPDHYLHGHQTAEPYIAALWGHSYTLNHDYDLMLTRPAQRALRALRDDWSPPDWTTQGPILLDRTSNLLRIWSVDSVLLHRPLAEVLRDRYEGRPSPRLVALRNLQPLPPVRVVPAVTFHADPQAALAAARASGYAVEEHAHWVREGEAASRSATTAGELEVVQQSWAQLRIRSRSTASRFVQIATTYDPGWSATADGHPVELYETATGQIGIELPAGDGVAEVRYRDPMVLVGALLSLGGLLGAIVLWTRPRHAG